MFFKTFVQRRSRRLIFIIIGYFLLILNSATTIEAAGKDIAFLNLCRYGTLDEIKAALDEGADPNSVFNGKYQPGLTPLMHAAEFNSNPDVLDALVKGGADVHDDIHGNTVLQHAIRNENRNVLRRILEIGVGAHEMVDAIDYAYSNCELDVIQMLLEASTGIKVIGIDEKTSFDEWEYKVIDVQVYQILSDVFEDHKARGSRQLGDFFRVEDRHGNIFDFDSGTSLAHHHMFKTDTWHYKNIGPTFTAIIPVAFDDPKEAEVLFLSPREEEKSRRDQTKIVYVNLKNTTAKSSVKTTNSKSPYVENVAARESEVKTREEEEVKLPDSVSQLDGVILDAVGREWPFKKILERAEKGVSEMQFLAGWGYDYGMPGLKIDYKKAAYWYEKSAGQGNAKAMAMLGHLYNNGMGLVKDEEEALKLWKQSLPGLERGTKKEDPYSMLILGGLLLQDRLGEKDPGKAFDLFTKAAELGLPVAMNNIGLMFYEGNGVEQDYARAMEWFKKAAELGYPEAMYNIGWMFYEGNGVEQDYARAMEWFKKAAELGYPVAMNNIGLMFYDGNGVEQDYARAMEWFKKAAELGLPVAMSNIGWMFCDGNGVEQDYARAMEWFKKAAELGYPAAMHNIGWMFEKGNGVEQDYARAMEWFKKAAELGYPAAMNNIGSMFYHGNGVEQDYARAMEWFKKAAELGYPVAMYNIGWMFYEGNGVEQDYARAMEWFKKAAELGYPEAMNSIGWMFEKGNGVEQDFDKAVEWYEKANALEDSSKVKPKGEIRIAKGIPYDARWQYSYIVDFYRDNVKALWKLEEIFELPVWTVVWEPGLGSLPFAVVFQGFFTNREGTIRKIFIFFSVFPERGTEILGIRHAFDGDFSFRGGLPGWLEYELEKFEGESSVKEQREN